jgi:hypothetical protein
MNILAYDIGLRELSNFATKNFIKKCLNSTHSEKVQVKKENILNWKWNKTYLKLNKFNEWTIIANLNNLPNIPNNIPSNVRFILKKHGQWND